MNNMNRIHVPKKRTVIGIILAVLIVIIMILCVKIVPAGSTGVVMTLGKVSDGVMNEGLNFKLPFVQTVAVINNKIQVVEVEAASVSKDLQIVSSKIAVNYRVKLDSAANIYKNIGRDYESVVLLPAVQESIKSATSGYTAEEMITLRAKVGEQMKETLEAKVSEYGIIIEKFNIINFDFSAEFNNAIEAKQVAEQNLIKTKTEQEQEILIAQAAAKKQIIAAEAEAESIGKKAEAQAEANRKIAQSLNDTIVEYEKIQKWDGKLPQATGGGAIFDFRGEGK
ncbi:MAG: prohibitin family protein [Oscillospiraceae bacterium]